MASIKNMQRTINWMISSTHGTKTLPLLGHYAGLFRIGNEVVSMHTDGVGTKVLVAQHMRKYDTIGIDCVAMNVNDLVCVGSKPVALVDYIALERQDVPLVKALVKGLVRAAKESDCAIVGGETAIMPDVIKGLSGCTGFDLAATVVGIADENKLITGKALQPGDALVGLESSGVHSNGLSLARKVVDLNKWGRDLLKPTKLYVKPALAMAAELDVHGIAHVTGGAFSKLMRIGKHANHGFILDSMPKPHSIFSEIQKNTRASVREMYRTFNMGVGLVVAVPEAQANRAVELSKNYGVRAKLIGSVSSRPGVWLVDGKEKTRLD